MTHAIIFCLLSTLGLTACGGAQAAKQNLHRAVGAYNEFLRWKKYDGAARFWLAEEQPIFMARYLAAEDDLNVDSVEIRQIAFPPVADGEPMVAVVTVVAQAYLLPSTVLEKIIMQQRWERREGAWLIIASDRELVPPLDPDPTSPPAEPAPNVDTIAPDPGAPLDEPADQEQD